MRSLRSLRRTVGGSQHVGLTAVATATYTPAAPVSTSHGTASSAATTTATATPNTSVHNTLHALRTRDITLRIPSKDHLLRVSFCSTRHLMAETVRRHDLLRTTGAHLPFLQLVGTQLTFTNLLASAQDGEERVETRFTAEEATILTEALALGECRCYLRPEYNAQLEEHGQPTFPLRVSRILYRHEKPFSSLVHADLTELLEVPPSTTSAADAASSDTVPFSLYTPSIPSRVPLDAWKAFFAYNSTLHAYNYLRRSDGCVPAVWMHSALDLAALQVGGLVLADGTVPARAASESTGENSEETPEQLALRALRHAISHSFGVLVTPLAAGAAVDREVGHLNRVLAEAGALLQRPPSSKAAVSPLQPLLDRCAETHATCQHVLSIVTGDYDGAHASAVAARQYSDDPAKVAAAVEPIRRMLGVDHYTIPLAPADAVRTGLDFFCRCSKQNMLDALVCAPESALASLKENNSTFSCSFCAKQHTLTAEDWASLAKVRTAPPAAAAPPPSSP